MDAQAIEGVLDRHPDRLHDLPEFRQRVHVFADRADAGAALADLLNRREPDRALVLAIPAGGVPVAASLAEKLHLPLDVAVVSKVTLPGNTEVGCGAVAFDGTVELNEGLIRRAALSEQQLTERVAETRAKVARRCRNLRPDRGPLDVKDRDTFLVDDGLASGFTMLVAAKAVRALGPGRLSVAVPTSPLRSARNLLDEVDEIWCANIRSGGHFAVADAYRNWRDVSEAEAAQLLRGA